MPTSKMPESVEDFMSALVAEAHSQFETSRLITTPLSGLLHSTLLERGFTNYFTESKESSAKNVITGGRMVSPKAKIAKNVTICPGAVIFDNVTIEDNCFIGANAVIGNIAEHREFLFEPKKSVVIGMGCFIGNGVTIDSGTTSETIVGNNCYLLRNSHVGHDVVIEEDVTISPNVILGGHSRVMRGASIGMGALVKQKLIIGSYSMLGMGGVLTKDISPGEIWFGNPAVAQKLNVVAMEKFSVTNKHFEAEKKRYEHFRLHR